MCSYVTPEGATSTLVYVHVYTYVRAAHTSRFVMHAKLGMLPLPAWGARGNCVQLRAMPMTFADRPPDEIRWELASMSSIPCPERRCS